MTWVRWMSLAFSAIILGSLVWLLAFRPLIRGAVFQRAYFCWIWASWPFRPDTPVPWTRLPFLAWLVVVVCSVGVPTTNALVGSPFLGGHDFWVTWEYVGLGSTIFFAVVMFFAWHFGSTPISDLLTAAGSGLFFSFVFLATAFVAAALALTVYRFPPPLTAFCLTLASFFYVHAQFQILAKPKPNKQHDPAYLEVRREANNTLRFSDIPTFFTFSFLCLFEVIATLQTDGEQELLHAFISGSISFQLLISNLIFGANYALKQPIQPQQSQGV